MAQDENDFLVGYLEEVQAYVPTMRTAIGELRVNPLQRGTQEELHRLAHIIRGASAMIGIDALSRIAGRMENVLEQVLGGRQELSPEALDAMEATVTRIASYCQGLQRGIDVDEARLIELTEADFKNFDPDADTASSLDFMQELIFNETLSEPGPNDELTGEFRAEALALSPPSGKIPEKGPGKGSLSDSLFSDEEKRLLREGFLEEAEEHLQQLHASMQMLAAEIDGRIIPDATEKEEIRKIRRAVHTIKGASAVIGLRELAAYAHGVEDFLDWLYETPRHLVPETVESLANALDCLGLLVESPEAVTPDRQADLLRHLLVISQENKPEEPPVENLSDATIAPYPSPLAGAAPLAPEPIAVPEPAPLEEGIAQEADAAAPRQAAAAETSRTMRINQGQLDVLINLAGELLVGISGFDQNMDLFKKALEEMELVSRRLKDIALELETKFEVKALDRLSRHFAHLDQVVADIETSQNFSEFDALELDRYTQLNLIIRSLNESTIDIAAIHTGLNGVYSGIGGDIGRQHRVIRELQLQMMRTRMSPMSTLSPRLTRTMRDVSSRLGKRVALTIAGGQVELDRMVWEKLADPFMHLVRNAIHHGIESPEERRARNKPELATITLAGRREGNHIVIRFSDDGRGLDFAAIREKARRFGLGAAVDRMNEEQLTEIIFYPGFSTKTISEISGRGVGMDVVKENIKELRGSITVETQAGVGTTFVLRVPFTLGVVRALLVKAGNVTYGIALNDIKDIHRLEEENISPAAGTCRVASETIPWYSLTDLLGATGETPDANHSLVLNMFAGERTVALSIPQIAGQKEIVVKGLSSHLRSVAGVSGAAVMGDGSIVPVLNISGLIQAAYAEHRDGAAFNLEIPRAFTVMIVDDSILIRRVMSRLVAANGWAPVEAKDGLDAVEQLEMGEIRPDCIVLDIEMPRMNGFEFLAKLPYIPDGKDIPVVMLTSRTSGKHREKALQLGARAFLNKPCKDEEFVETVLRLTGRAGASEPETEQEIAL